MKASHKKRLKRIFDTLDALRADLETLTLDVEGEDDPDDREITDLGNCADAVEKAIDEIKILVGGE